MSNSTELLRLLQETRKREREGQLSRFVPATPSASMESRQLSQSASSVQRTIPSAPSPKYVRRATTPKYCQNSAIIPKPMPPMVLMPVDPARKRVFAPNAAFTAKSVKGSVVLDRSQFVHCQMQMIPKKIEASRQLVPKKVPTPKSAAPVPTSSILKPREMHPVTNTVRRNVRTAKLANSTQPPKSANEPKKVFGIMTGITTGKPTRSSKTEAKKTLGNATFPYQPSPSLSTEAPQPLRSDPLGGQAIKAAVLVGLPKRVIVPQVEMKESEVLKEPVSKGKLPSAPKNLPPAKPANVKVLAKVEIPRARPQDRKPEQGSLPKPSKIEPPKAQEGMVQSAIPKKGTSNAIFPRPHQKEAHQPPKKAGQRPHKPLPATKPAPPKIVDAVPNVPASLLPSKAGLPKSIPAQRPMNPKTAPTDVGKAKPVVVAKKIKALTLGVNEKAKPIVVAKKVAGSQSRPLIKRKALQRNEVVASSRGRKTSQVEHIPKVQSEAAKLDPLKTLEENTNLSIEDKIRVLYLRRKMARLDADEKKAPHMVCV